MKTVAALVILAIVVISTIIEQSEAAKSASPSSEETVVACTAKVTKQIARKHCTVAAGIPATADQIIQNTGGVDADCRARVVARIKPGCKTLLGVQ